MNTASMNTTNQTNVPAQWEDILKGFAEMRATLDKMMEKNQKETEEFRKQRKEEERKREEEEKRLKKEAEERQKKEKEHEQFKKEMEAEAKKRNEEIKNLNKLLGSTQHNLSDVAEEAFYQRLRSTKKIGNIRFDSVSRNVRDFKENEYDVVLENGQYVAVVEVKHKLHPNDIHTFVTKKIPSFKNQFIPAQGKKIVAAVGGMSVVPDAQKKAEEYGVYVLSQSGANITEINQKNFIPKMY